METFRMLLVEDDEDAVKQYQAVIDAYTARVALHFEVTVAKSLEDACTIVSGNEFDGAVIDLKLRTDSENDKFEGNQFIEMFTSTVRCPVIVFSANYMNLSEGARAHVFRIFDRTEGFSVVLEQLELIHKSGMSKIMNKSGTVESYLNEIYWTVLWERRDTWLAYAKDNDSAKNAMLRLVLNHLVEFIGQENKQYFPDEAYLKVFDTSVLRTGQLHSNMSSGETFVIISPACDLFVHDDGPKSDFIQLCKIYCHQEKQICDHLADADIELPSQKDPMFNEMRLRKKKAKAFIENIHCNGADCYHYLPKSGSFKGGVMNFRDVLAVKRDLFLSEFRARGIQISPPFLKDIVGRFSAYYARQGAPTFDLKGLVGRQLLEK